MHHLTKLIPFEHCNIVEYGDVEFSGFNHSDRLDDIYKAYCRIKDADVFPLSIGGGRHGDLSNTQSPGS